MRKKKPSFSLNCRYLCLTYAQCPLSTGKSHPKQIKHFIHIKTHHLIKINIDEFKTLIAEVNNRAETYWACREVKEAHIHFHLFADPGVNNATKRPPHIRNARAFDIGGKREGRETFPVYHPNIAPVGKRDALWHYIDKQENEKDETFGNMPDPCKLRSGITSANFFHTAIQNATSAQEYLTNISDVSPEIVTKCWPSQEAYAKWKWPKQRPEPSTWTPPRRSRPFVEIPILSLWKKIFITQKKKGRQVSKQTSFIPEKHAKHSEKFFEDLKSGLTSSLN